MPNIESPAVTTTREGTPRATAGARAAKPTPRGGIPGEWGIWAFILTDFCVFGGYFGTFLVLRGQQPEVFRAGSEALNPTHGAVNTVFMLTASLCVALAIRSVREGRKLTAQKLLVGAGLCGTAFIVNKPIEWAGQLAAGHGPHQSDFFQLYYLLTGIHLLHVIVAMAVVAFMWRKVRKVQVAPTVRQARYLENGASYWHLVDLIWMVLFALFYLVR
jgi:nitric oxide reductase NorE protein